MLTPVGTRPEPRGGDRPTIARGGAGADHAPAQREEARVAAGEALEDDSEEASAVLGLRFPQQALLRRRAWRILAYS